MGQEGEGPQKESMTYTGDRTRWTTQGVESRTGVEGGWGGETDSALGDLVRIEKGEGVDGVCPLWFKGK